MPTTALGDLPDNEGVSNKVALYNAFLLALLSLELEAPLSKNVALSTSPLTLTAAESQSNQLQFTGVRGSALTIIASPTATPRRFSVFNNATTQTLTIKVTSGGTGVAVATGTTVFLEHDGTNVILATGYISGLTTGTIPRAGSSSTLINGALTDDGTSVAFTNSAGILQWASRSQISSSADGNILLRNNAANAFTLLQFGGTTSSFPALKRSTVNLQVRLADDSAYTPLEVNALSVYNGGGTVRSVLMRDSTGVELISTMLVGWNSSTTDASSAKDTTLARSAAGIIAVTSCFEFTEIADPTAPAANKGRLYVKDNGSGKSLLVCRFPSGAVQIVATEP